MDATGWIVSTVILAAYSLFQGWLLRRSMRMTEDALSLCTRLNAMLQKYDGNG